MNSAQYEDSVPLAVLTRDLGIVNKWHITCLSHEEELGSEYLLTEDEIFAGGTGDEPDWSHIDAVMDIYFSSRTREFVGLRFDGYTPIIDGDQVEWLAEKYVHYREDERRDTSSSSVYRSNLTTRLTRHRVYEATAITYPPQAPPGGDIMPNSDTLGVKPRVLVELTAEEMNSTSTHQYGITS